tara:strand:+ start:247 stop:741 length:495 start_codon:yes stop_codon:yes gene_type:complete
MGSEIVDATLVLFTIVMVTVSVIIAITAISKKDKAVKINKSGKIDTNLMEIEAFLNTQTAKDYITNYFNNGPGANILKQEIGGKYMSKDDFKSGKLSVMFNTGWGDQTKATILEDGISTNTTDNKLYIPNGVGGKPSGDNNTYKFIDSTSEQYQFDITLADETN